MIDRRAHRRLEAAIHGFGLDRERVKAWVKAQWGVEHFPDLTHERLRALEDRLEGWAERLAIQQFNDFGVSDA
jgi:hypothetical protein